MAELHTLPRAATGIPGATARPLPRLRPSKVAGPHAPAPRERRMTILEDEENDDPILSVVNIIDVFLVIIAVLLIAVLENPLNPFATQDVVVIKNPGQPSMEMLVKEGKELKHYKSSGQMGEGQGAKAGTAYRLKDGSMIYVPEGSEAGGTARP